MQKRTSLTVRDNGTFVIMQLTDLHLTTNGTYNKDKQTLKWVEEALDTVKPEFPWRSLPLSMRQRATDKPVKEKAA